MAFSIELELADGGTVIYDNVVSYTVEEISEPSPDEVPEEGEEEREGGSDIDDEELEIEVDLSDEDEEEGEELKSEINPMEETEEETA